MIPCLNEEETIALCVQKSYTFLQTNRITGEVLVSDNGSTDNSRELARRTGARVVETARKGYGSALLNGIAEARGVFIIMGDGDDSYDFLNLDAFLHSLRSGADLVVGNRFAGGIHAGAMPPLHRYIGNPLLSAIGRWFFGSQLRDFHCGLRGFRKQSISSLKLTQTGMEFASEMIVKATLVGMNIQEVPTVLHPDGRSRPSHLRTWSDGWRHLRFLLLYSPRWLFLYPGALFFLFGLLTVSILTFGNPGFGTLNLGVIHQIIGLAFAIVGYQSVWFAVLTKVFASRENLLPTDTRVQSLRRNFPLEKLLLVSMTLVILALTGLIAATSLNWGDSDSSSDKPLRYALPSIGVLILAFQTILSSLMLSIISMGSTCGDSDD